MRRRAALHLNLLAPNSVPPSSFDLLPNPHFLSSSGSSTSQQHDGASYKPRKQRTRTGCRVCRTRKVKCREGAVVLGTDGEATGKRACEQCGKAGTQCEYPLGKEGWTAAVIAGDGGMSGGGEGGPSRKRARRSSTPLGEIGHRVEQSTEYDPLAPWIDGGHLVPTLPSHRHASSRPFDTSLDESPHQVSNATHPLSMSPAWRALLSTIAFPSPTSPLNNFTLSSLPLSLPDRLAVAYFEQRGFDEIVSAEEASTNFIWSGIFPLLVQQISPNTQDPLGRFAYHSLLRLAYIHRANVGGGEDMEDLRAEAKTHHELSLLASTEVQFLGMGGSDPYLASFFVNCMADMLGCLPLSLDASCSADIVTSPFGRDVQDHLAVYSLYQYACQPLSSPNTTCTSLSPSSDSPVLALRPVGSEYVQSFFGISRPIFLLFKHVHSLVRKRHTLLTSVRSFVLPPAPLEVQLDLLRIEADTLATTLGPAWAWSERHQEPGQPLRVQRGSNVMRTALRVVVLCELLAVPLNDSRMQTARETILEYVNDEDPNTMAGHIWALSIVGIYTSDTADRRRFLDAIELTRASSFGVGFRGVLELVELCWKAYDGATGEGKEGYVDGIAPWRELLGSVGRNMYV